MKNIILICLIVAFNDFVGTVLMAVGSLIARLGSLLSQIPDIF
tara:strand:- start:239 stop:367 length:129 start_codon:yes stop_codon:yes gene_type:complete